MQKNPKIKLLFSTPKWRIGKPQWSIMGTLGPKHNSKSRAKKFTLFAAWARPVDPLALLWHPTNQGRLQVWAQRNSDCGQSDIKSDFLIVSYGRSTWRYGVKLNLFYSANLTEWVECNSENQDKVNSALWGPLRGRGESPRPLRGSLGHLIKGLLGTKEDPLCPPIAWAPEGLPLVP